MTDLGDGLMMDAWFLRRAVTDYFESARGEDFALTAGMIVDLREDIASLRTLVLMAEFKQKERAA